ncbi:MAG: GDP-L-fucose synthase [bacterium]
MNSPCNLFPTTRVYVAGHQGLVGSSLVRALEARGVKTIITKSRSELDLTDGPSTKAFLESQRPDIVIDAAARVGGIGANSTYPAEFIYQNLAMAMNLIHGSWQTGIQRLLFLGSSCIYPREAPQPMKEEHLLTSPLEPTNEPYAIAKIAGLKLCQYYRKQYGVLYHSLMPTNLYGPGDNYHPYNAHVIPALIRRFNEAREVNAPEVIMWGTGTPRREFLYVDDLASAALRLLETPNPPDLINVGSGTDLSLLEVAHMICDTVGYKGKIVFDATKPDGTPRKLMDNSLIRGLGWKPTVDLRTGLALSYASFMKAHRSGHLREV